MTSSHPVAAHTLLAALLDGSRVHSLRLKAPTMIPPTVRSHCEDVSPFTLREGLFFEFEADLSRRS